MADPKKRVSENVVGDFFVDWRNEEIEHDTLEDLAGPAFGHVTTFMKRNRQAEA